MQELSYRLRRFMATVAFAITACSLTAVATAEDAYPNRSLKILVGFPPGGGVDTIGRALAVRLTESMGKTVIVENRPGANGNISAGFAANSPADGYTLLLITVSHSISQSLYSKLNYSLEKDFAPVNYLGRVSEIIVVNPNSKIKTMDDFLAQAKAQPGSIRYGTSGIGSGEHIAGTMLEQMAQLKLMHVPYKGGSDAMIAVVGGSIESSITTLVTANNFVKAGTLRPLAVSSLQRSPMYPDLPTVHEATGNSGYEMYTWYGAVVRVGTPKPIIDRLNAELNKALNHPEMRKVLNTVGIELVGGTPEHFGQIIKTDVAKYGRVIKDANLTLD